MSLTSHHHTQPHLAIHEKLLNLPLFYTSYGHCTCLSIKARNLCLYFRLCVCLKYLCRSGSDRPEIFNIVAAWFAGSSVPFCASKLTFVDKWDWTSLDWVCFSLRIFRYLRTTKWNQNLWMFVCSELHLLSWGTRWRVQNRIYDK